MRSLSLFAVDAVLVERVLQFCLEKFSDFGWLGHGAGFEEFEVRGLQGVDVFVNQDLLGMLFLLFVPVGL